MAAHEDSICRPGVDLGRKLTLNRGQDYDCDFTETNTSEYTLQWKLKKWENLFWEWTNYHVKPKITCCHSFKNFLYESFSQPRKCTIITLKIIIFPVLKTPKSYVKRNLRPESLKKVASDSIKTENLVL